MGIVIDMTAARRARRRPAPPFTAGALAAPALFGGLAILSFYVLAASAVASMASVTLNTWRS